MRAPQNVFTSLTKWLRAINILIRHPSPPRPVLLWRASWRRGRKRQRNQNLNRGGKGEEKTKGEPTRHLKASYWTSCTLLFAKSSVIRNCTMIYSEACKGAGHSFIKIDFAAKIAHKRVCCITRPTWLYLNYVMFIAFLLPLSLPSLSPPSSSPPSSLSLSLPPVNNMIKYNGMKWTF